ncbi:MAG TPA: phosphoadenosine phosphosulfate reductase family protein, partial [Rhizomicrobium sp.]
MSATVTVIDRNRGISPRAFDRPGAASHDPIIAAKLAKLQAAAAGRDARGIIELALESEPRGKTAVVSSFGAESAVLLHLVAQVDPSTPILFLNTGKLFGETLRYRDRLQDELGLTDIRSLGPHPA